MRLLAEMNQANNGYSAFDRNGRSRGPAPLDQGLPQPPGGAATLILRGGPRAAIDAKLRALRLPPIQGGDGDLPQPQIALMWVPQTEGSPAITANSARAYWPGGALRRLGRHRLLLALPHLRQARALLRRVPRQAVRVRRVGAVGPRRPGFVRRFFGWIRSHRRVQMQLYNQGELTNGPFRLNRYPRSRAAMRTALRHRRFLTRP